MNNNNKGMSLNIKFILTLTPVVAIVIGLVLVFLYISIHNGIYDLQKQNMIQSSEQLKEEVQTIIEDISAIVYLNSTRNIVKTELKNQKYEEIQEVCNNQLDLNPYLEAVMLADRNGKLIAHTVESSIGLDITGFPFWEGVRNKKVHVDNYPYVSPVTNHSVFVIASAVYDDSGNFIGLFAMPVDLVKISQEFLKGIEYGDNGYPVIFDDRGKVIAHNDISLLLEEVTFVEHIYTSDRKDGFDSYVFNGENKYIAFYRLNKVDWFVGATIGENDMLELSRTVMLILLIAGGVAFVLLLIAILLSLRYLIIKPVNKLSKLVDNVTKGNTSIERFQLKAKDEIGKLVRQFNTMVDFLEDRNYSMREVAGGNLTIEVDLASEKDEIGKALRDMIQSLNEIVGQINASAEQISNGAGQISDSSQTLSSGTTNQATAIEEITASINELSSQVQSNVENIQKLDHLINEAKDYTIKSDKRMSELIEAIQMINKSSEDIKNIVKVIDDIAFQTNLLALNADIEAARVGKYGKGFAVVANSVRNLATKSQESVKETNKMVEEVIERIEKGNNLVELTSSQLKEITGSTKEMTELAIEVSESSQEQANGIEQISNGLASIEDVVQNNSANAEQNAASSEELSAQADKLKSLVSYFSVKEETIKQLKVVENNDNNLKTTDDDDDDDNDDDEDGE